MKPSLRALGHYFGLVDDDPGGAARDCRVPGDALEFHYVRDSLLRSAVTTSFLALAGALLVYAVFDWSVDHIAIGTAVGVVLWGAATLFDTGGLIPRKALPPPPDEAVLRRGPTRSWKQHAQALVLVAPALLAIAWFADRVDVGAAFVPGQFAGSAAARFLTASLVARWERQHGQRVLTASDDSSRDHLYAVPAAARTAPARPAT